jgi:hypothetical protein
VNVKIEVGGLAMCPCLLLSVQDLSLSLSLSLWPCVCVCVCVCVSLFREWCMDGVFPGPDFPQPSGPVI